MIYTLQVFQSPHHQQQHQTQTQQIKNILIRNCEYCKKEFTVKCESIKKKYCTIQCAGKVKRVDHICVGCGKLFHNFTDRHKNRVNPKFCNKGCYNENGLRFRYNYFYYCDHCEGWIPQKNAIIYNNWPCCPCCAKDSHFNNIPHKLKISAQKSKFNQIRKQVKYIE